MFDLHRPERHCLLPLKTQLGLAIDSGNGRLVLHLFDLELVLSLQTGVDEAAQPANTHAECQKGNEHQEENQGVQRLQKFQHDSHFLSSSAPESPHILT